MIDENIIRRLFNEIFIKKEQKISLQISAARKKLSSKNSKRQLLKIANLLQNPISKS